MASTPYLDFYNMKVRQANKRVYKRDGRVRHIHPGRTPTPPPSPIPKLEEPTHDQTTDRYGYGSSHNYDFGQSPRRPFSSDVNREVMRERQYHPTYVHHQRSHQKLPNPVKRHVSTRLTSLTGTPSEKRQADYEQLAFVAKRLREHPRSNAYINSSQRIYDSVWYNPPLIGYLYRNPSVIDDLEKNPPIQFGFLFETYPFNGSNIRGTSDGFCTIS